MKTKSNGLFRTICASFIINIASGGCIHAISHSYDTPDAPPSAWLSPFGQSHPLSGRFWHPSTNRFVEPEAVLQSLARADYILLGEKHDNPDHHRMQASLVRRLIERGRRPAVAFEMFTLEQAPIISAYLAEHPKDAGGLGAAVHWEKIGWPEWAIYQPIAQAALDAGLPILAANLPRATVHALMENGISALDPHTVKKLGIDVPLDEKRVEAMATEIRESHCNQLPEKIINPMVLAQRARDATMADSLIQALSEQLVGGAVLITGNGHARNDHGVPFHLQNRDPRRTTITVGMVEVRDGITQPWEHVGNPVEEQPLYDLIWFTPRVENADPCEKYKDQLERFHKKP